MTGVLYNMAGVLYNMAGVLYNMAGILYNMAGILYEAGTAYPSRAPEFILQCQSVIKLLHIKVRYRHTCCWTPQQCIITQYNINAAGHP